MKLSIVIPVYNEAATVRDLLDRVYNVALPEGMTREMLVVENGSTDGTRELVDAFARVTRDPEVVRVIHLPAARGKGFAVREGLARVTGDIVMIQDGDLEYDVNDYPALLAPILDGRTKLVLGSRHLSAGSWKIRRFEERPLRALGLNIGGIFFHGLFNLLYGVRLSDPTTMYKVFRRECLDGIHFSANRFDFDYELLGKLIRTGCVPFEVPVSYASRDFSQGKKIHVLRDPWTWIWAIVRFRFSRI